MNISFHLADGSCLSYPIKSTITYESVQRSELFAGARLTEGPLQFGLEHPWPITANALASVINYAITGIEPILNVGLDTHALKVAAAVLGIDHIVKLCSYPKSSDWIKFLPPTDKKIVLDEIKLKESLNQPGDLRHLDEAIIYTLNSRRGGIIYDGSRSIHTHGMILITWNTIEMTSCAILHLEYQRARCPIKPIYELYPWLKDVDWTDMCLSGGAMECYEGGKTGYGDYDIFPTSTDDVKVKQAIDRITRQLAKPGTLFTRSAYALTFYAKDSKRIQIILRKSNSISQVLTDFHFDCVKMAWDGKQFYALDSFKRSIETRRIILRPDINNSALGYCLLKYANRGYDIMIPGLVKDRLPFGPRLSNGDGLAKVLRQLTVGADENHYMPEDSYDEGIGCHNLMIRMEQIASKLITGLDNVSRKRKFFMTNDSDVCKMLKEKEYIMSVIATYDIEQALGIWDTNSLHTPEIVRGLPTRIPLELIIQEHDCDIYKRVPSDWFKHIYESS